MRLGFHTRTPKSLVHRCTWSNCHIIHDHTSYPLFLRPSFALSIRSYSMMCMNSSTKGTWLACDVIDQHRTTCTHTGTAGSLPVYIYFHMARWTTGIPVCIGIVCLCILKQNTVLQNTSNRLQLFLTAKIAVSDLQSISSPWNQHFFLPYYIIRESESDRKDSAIYETRKQQQQQQQQQQYE